MKYPLNFLGFMLFLSSCSNTNSELNTGNIAVVEKYVKAVQDKNVDSMAALLADDYIGYGPSFSDSIDKADAIANWKNLAANLYESIQYTRSVNVAAKVTDGPHPGDYVSNWASLTITYKNGKGPINLHINVVYRIENGKINLSRTFYNEADAMRQLGYQFIPPAQ